MGLLKGVRLHQHPQLLSPCIVEEVDDAVSNSPLTEEMVHSVGAHVATDLNTVGVQVGPTKHKNALIQVNPKTRSMGKHTNNRS